MDYVDDELSGKLRSDFLAHALICPECERELKEIQHVRKLLGNLTPLTASSEFDFRLRGRLNRESSLLGSPWYRMRLYFFDNIHAFLTMPAAAVILLAGFFLYSGNGLIQNNGVQVTNQISPGNEAPAAQSIVASPDEDVYYVLDSEDTGKTSNSGVVRNVSAQRTGSTETVSLISF